jgi:hypothetical protein
MGKKFLASLTASVCANLVSAAQLMTKSNTVPSSLWNALHTEARKIKTPIQHGNKNFWCDQVK